MNELIVKQAETLQAFSNLYEMGCYTSMPLETDADKKALYNAVNASDEGLKGNINKVIKMRHVYIEPVEMAATDEKGEKTGDVNTVPRTIIVDDEGKSYACCSKGVFNAVKRIIGLYGTPDTWEKPLPVVPTLKQIGKNNVLFLVVK